MPSGWWGPARLRRSMGHGIGRVPDLGSPSPGLWAQPPEPRSALCRLCVLLLVCAAQAWLMWRFIHSQLRHWREYWNEQSAKRRASAAPRLPARLIKRESGTCQGLGQARRRLSVAGRKESGPWALPRPVLRPALRLDSLPGPGAPGLQLRLQPGWHVAGCGPGTGCGWGWP